MRTAAAALAIVSLGCLLTACTHHEAAVAPPSVKPSLLSQEPLAPVQPQPLETTPPAAVPSRSASSSPSPSGFSEAYVAFCNGRPSGEQVIAAVRRVRTGLPGGSGVSIQKAPVCAGVWQYTILNVSDSEPMRVITKGAPTALTVVTLGTDPCTVEVRATAPQAFLDAVECN
ncbi:hypothetical protein [Dactylosporangium matsuzakiense]|uniref:Lipoprotein n=1 Tax=Dactylosporangium matsuzakiense TaxID=53360 RepID=A0A9W6KLE8_9ACTN|nr:hypothetical protein [Dactylosporangium matsuzakiense]UWZ44885.1 hypothetical protein Dmats_47570 [Dactylosporangium matsuzakiense]GLL03638.1 hypothetical protein GCM10017581_053840 [Dactylosporangium matsuzakiense]